MTSRIILSLVALVVGLTGRPASATMQFVYGFDLDQVSQPRFTEPGFQSVTQCTLSAGEPVTVGCLQLADTPPAGQPGAGYLAASRASQDFRVVPIADATVSHDLWGDGHRALPGQAATLRITGLTPGAYELRLFSASPDATQTIFSIDGVDVGTIGGSQANPNLDSTNTLIRSVVVGPSGILDLGYRGNGFAYGALNGGAFYVPEPTSIALLAAGVLVLSLRARGRTH